jgi:Rad52/22 family double-strand break repair protein/PD-(D/E)XK nuclease superfamily
MTFERHDIDHLSASSLNLWIANPRQWAVRYLAQEPDDDGDPSLWRGTAVEAGLAQWFSGQSIENARAAACDAFELNAVGDLSDDVEAERGRNYRGGLLYVTAKRLAYFEVGDEDAREALDTLRAAAQSLNRFLAKVRSAEEAAVDVDLKTTRACPSAPRANHVRQAALYRAARDGWGVAYITKVRVVIGAGESSITREGVGAGQGIDSDLGAAHESAVKEAETDAMKRALITFGNPFGLALYDKDQANVADGNGHDAKAQFIVDCKQTISNFGDAAALIAWWNSDNSKHARRAARLTREEIEGLKTLVLERKGQLSG